jgi:hypothetical protein
MPLIRLVGVPIVVALAACAAAREPVPPPVTVDRATPPAAPKPAACGRKKPIGCVGLSPSFAREVAPVLERRCLSCHANGGVAAEDHDFSRFATLHAQKDAVLAEVAACSMPPSKAPTLQPEEADVLLRWVACGAQQN